MDIKKMVANVPKNLLPIPNPTDAANHAFNRLVDAYKECTIISEQEQTGSGSNL